MHNCATLNPSVLSHCSQNSPPTIVRLSLKLSCVGAKRVHLQALGLVLLLVQLSISRLVSLITLTLSHSSLIGLRELFGFYSLLLLSYVAATYVFVHGRHSQIFFKSTGNRGNCFLVQSCLMLPTKQY